MSTSSDADRYSDVKLNLVCPQCGSEGLIPLEQLDQLLFCHGCQTRFRLERQGLVELPHDRLQVQVRSHMSAWQGHEAILENRSAAIGNWLLNRGIGFLASGWRPWALACVVLLAIGGTIAMGGRTAAEKPALEIPDSLDGRAKLLTEAVVRRDMEILIRLTDPAQHRSLRIWLAHGSGIPQPVEDKEITVTTKVVSTTFSSVKGDHAEVRVQVSPSTGNPTALIEQWVQQGTVWYFQPIRLRSPSATKGTVQPYSKPTRR